MNMELYNFSAIIPELIVAVGINLLIVLGLVTKGRGATAWFALAVVAAAAFSLPGVPTGVSFSGMFVVDGYATFFKSIFLLTAALTLLLSGRYLEARREDNGEFDAVLLSSLLGMMIMASAADLMMLYVGLELMALSTYVLAGFLRAKVRSNESAVKYLLLGAFSTAFLLYAISLVYGLTGTTNLKSVASVVASGELAGNITLLLAVLFLVVAFGFKVAAVPFHMWAPDVYEGAPTPVTAFMSVGPKAAGFAVMARVFVAAFPAVQADWVRLLSVVAILTMAVGNILALGQTNIKRMLAYSSVAHAGYLMLGVIAGTPEGMSGLMTYLMVYAFMNIGAFGVLILLDRSGEDMDKIESLRGLSKTRPLIAFFMLVFMFSLTGIPPTAGFMGKFYVFMSVVHAGHTGLVIAAVLFSSISAFYYLRVVKVMYMEEPEAGAETAESAASPLTARLVVAVSFAGVVVLGLFPDLLLDLARSATRLL